MGDPGSARRVTSGCDLPPPPKMILTQNHLLENILISRRITALPFARERRCREDRREERQVKTTITKASGEYEAPTRRSEQGSGDIILTKVGSQKMEKPAIRLEGDNIQVQETHRWFAQHLFQL